MPPKDPKGIVIGQTVRREQIARARDLRKNMTAAENTLWELLRERRLNGRRFRTQQPIRGFYADFFCNAAGVVVEVDGPVHEQRREQEERRDAVFRAMGLIVLRVSNDDVRFNPSRVCELISAACSRTWKPAG